MRPRNLLTGYSFPGRARTPGPRSPRVQGNRRLFGVNPRVRRCASGRCIRGFGWKHEDAERAEVARKAVEELAQVVPDGHGHGFEPCTDTDIQIGPTGRKLLPLSVVRGSGPVGVR